MFLQWRQANLTENARHKALNEVAKTRIDLEVKDLKERKDTINKILEDMTKASRDKIEKYNVPVERMEDEEETQTLEEARERGESCSFSRQPERYILCRASRTTRYSSMRDRNSRKRPYRD